ncbi:Heat shock 70 kDa protein C [Linum grandiflorum]
MESGQRNVLVFNLGGRIFDVSMLKIDNRSVVEDLSTSVDSYLEGVS